MNRWLARNHFFDALAQRFDLRERLGALEWCKRYIDIPPEVSLTHPGPFNPNLFPLANIVYDWFDDPQWREAIIVKGSQNGVSLAFQNLTCYIADYELGDIMWVLESATKGREMNNERLKPMLKKACRHLEIPENEDALQNFVLWLKGMRINIAGARSAGQVASRTLRYVFGDEGDEWPTELQGGESNAWTLLRDRVKLVEDSKSALFSKPRSSVDEGVEDLRQRNRKKQEDGIIWKQYLSGTRHKCFIPCPDCGHFFDLTWEKVKYSHCRASNGKSWDFIKMAEETYIQCPKCPRKISDYEKVHQIIHHRKWQATNPGTDGNPALPGRMSIHMSDLYNNSIEFPKLSIGNLAIICCSAKDADARKAFRRSNLALPVENKAIQRLETKCIEVLAGNYERYTCPVDPVVALIEIDVQGHGQLFKWSKWAFTMDDDMYLIDHGETELEDEIANIMDKPYDIVDEDNQSTGKTIKTGTGWVDEGDGTCIKQVLDLCISPRLFRRIQPCKGRGGSQTEHMTDRVMLQKNRTHNGKPIDRYLIDGDYFMDDLYEERIGKYNKWIEEGSKGDAPGPRIHFYKNPDPKFCEEFTTEKKDWHLRGTKMIFGWLPKPQGGKNDYSDTAKLALANWFLVKQKLRKIHAAMESLKKSSPDTPTVSPSLGESGEAIKRDMRVYDLIQGQNKRTNHVE